MQEQQVSTHATEMSKCNRSCHKTGLRMHHACMPAGNVGKPLALMQQRSGVQLNFAALQRSQHHTYI